MPKHGCLCRLRRHSRANVGGAPGTKGGRQVCKQRGGVEGLALSVVRSSGVLSLVGNIRWLDYEAKATSKNS